MAAELTELRLPAFKSIRRGVVPISRLTLIVGRNGSGKSNVLDALSVLAALAAGSDLRDGLDGRSGPVVRGGSEGCAPIGDQFFELGCSALIDGLKYHLDVKIQVSPDLQVVSERLWTIRTSGPKKGEPLDLLKSEPPAPYSADILARWDNGQRGTNPSVTMRATQLLTSQISTRVPATSIAGRKLHEIAEAFVNAVRGIFILDPVPNLMREYVPEKDNRLRRNADNLSGTLRRLLQDEATRGTLLEMTRALSESQVSDLTSVSSDLGDVMVTVEELIGGQKRAIPARLMSDGTLRFMAIAAAMLDVPESEAPSVDVQSRTLVVEELENGLHPSQASLLLGRLQESGKLRRVRTVATTHSPTILDALSGSDHDSVIVASRGPDGWSTLTRLTDFPDYFEVVGRSTLGTTAVQDRLRPKQVDRTEIRASLAAILGR